MSSLLQFGGQIDRKRGVGLLFCRERKVDVPCGDFTYQRTVDAETYTCAQCGKSHGVLYRAWRKPCGMLGCWVQFRYNGEIHVPDLSVPIGVQKLPRDAVRLSDAEASEYWHG